MALIEFIHGDCIDVMKDFNEDRFDLIITSPPYADRRKKQYDGPTHDEYVDWFGPIQKEMYRILKPTGTFILNIKENVIDGERSTYVMDLVISLRKNGWLWTEEFIWNKTVSMPGYWPNRLRDGWEHIFQFNKNRKFSMYQDAIKRPPKESTIKRVKNLSQKDKIRNISATGSGFGRNIANFSKDMVLPDNVITMSPVTTDTKHPAAFPVQLPEYFIKLFTVSGDDVLDPFSGSGSAGVACQNLGRRFTGIDNNKQYVDLAKGRILPDVTSLFH